jgi:Cu/Ag efflux pump CusA
MSEDKNVKVEEKSTKPEVPTAPVNSELVALKKEAAELGIKFSPNITEKTLAARIETFYESSSKDAVTLAPETGESTANTPEKRKAKAEEHMRTFARDTAILAKKTRVVTITDNDQRVNNVTTTCTANCSNGFFDLGTIILPLNEKVEVRQGHLDALSGVKIPHHVRSESDPSMSVTVMRSRYAIHHENTIT